jgi:hypothetical protein
MRYIYTVNNNNNNYEKKTINNKFTPYLYLGNRLDIQGTGEQFDQ